MVYHGTAKGWVRSRCQEVVETLLRYFEFGRQRTVEVLRARERGMHAHRFGQYEQAFRSQGYPVDWYHIDSERVSPSLPQVVLRVLSAHPSGYVRQAAVEAMQVAPESIPWLLARANDWYPPIAAAASAKALLCLTPESVPQWLSSMQVLEASERPSSQALWAATQRLCNAEPERFVTLIEDECVVPGVRRLAWKVLYATHEIVALEVGARSFDLMIRARVLQLLRDPERIRKFLVDPSGSLRQRAIFRLAEGGSLRLQDVRSALLDSSPRVREAAAFYARKLASLEWVRQVYEEAPLSPAKLEGSLGIIPDEELGPLVQASLSHPESKIQRAAMQAWDRLDRGAEHLWWQIVCTDPNPQRRTWARKLLKQRRSYYLVSESLWKAIAQAKPSVRLELEQIAANSRCIFTRVRELLYQVARNPEPWAERQFFEELNYRQRGRRPYAFTAEQRAILDTLVAQWPERLTAWAETIAVQSLLR